jgi:hypothetical protein
MNLSQVKLTRALESARHELVTLNGLLAADGTCPSRTWSIDATAVIAEIDDALSVSPASVLSVSRPVNPTQL